MLLRGRVLTSRSTQYELIDGAERQSPVSPFHYPYGLPLWSVLKIVCFTKKTLLLLVADLVFLGIILHTLSPLISLLQHNQELFPALFEVSSTQVSQSSMHLNHQIPRILHQTAKNETIPDIWVDSQESCLTTYSSYEYKLWTDDGARSFLAAEYPWFLQVWDNYPFPIQRADAIRYFALYRYGGIYLDMDTICHEAFPIDQIESDNITYNCLFEGTLPTGVTNDIMVSSRKHPAFERAINLLPFSYSLTWWWAKLQPYAAIMSSTGPLFISLAIADYLYEQPSLPSPTVQVIAPTGLKPYISDLQTATWHGWDAHALKWLSNKPFVWLFLGTFLIVGVFYILNKILLLVLRIIISTYAGGFTRFRENS